MFSSNATQVVAASTPAEAVDYDSTNDYLSRSTYYNGYVNALTFLKETFTFSCWFYNGESTGNAYVFSSGASSGNANLFYVNISTTAFQIRAYDGSGTFILNATTTNTLPLNTFCNLIVSCDMTSTSNRYVYVNDQLMTMTWSNYVNSTIQFGTLIQRVNSLSNSVDPTACRISNVFLDFTYRDLSITANRRLFVTADLKPAAGQAALNPIVYLAMSDPTTVGTNTGTGGNFTLNGTIARSGRGPNQYNAPMSMFDGVADYLGRTSLTGIANGKQFTFSCAYRGITGSGGVQPVLWIGYAPSISWYVIVDTANKDLNILAKTAANVTILSATIRNNVLIDGRNLVVTVSVDLTDTAKRHVYINGTLATMTWTTYTNDNIAFMGDTCNVARNGSGTYTNAYIGAIWFNTSYIDLSVASNLAKFVSGTGIDAKPVDLGANGELPTGTSPLIYLPMYGNNAGKNYGTGGDFTVNSGPYTGARGPNEFWGNKADFTYDPYLSRATALTGITNSKKITLSFWAQFDNFGQVILSLANSSGGLNFYVDNASNTIRVLASNAAGSLILNVSTPSLVTGTAYYIQMSADLTSTSLRSFYINGASSAVTWSTYTNDTINYAGANLPTIGAYWNGSQYTAASRLDGRIAELYLSNEYVDFTQEANRLKFRDCFGNPTDLPSAITAASVPTPAIYMRFPPTSFGTNSGTGGDFTVNGTISDGGQL